MDAVPAERIASSCARSLRAWKRPSSSTRPKWRLAERPELLGPVLVDVPGVVGLLRPGRRQGQQVRRRDVGDAARLEHRLEVLEDRARVLRRARSSAGRRPRRRARRSSRPGRARSAGWAARSAARACSWASGLASTPTTLAAAPGEHVRAVALAAGHVDDPPAGDPLGDPLVDDQVAPVPVVLLGHVGQGPLAGQRQRRHPLGLVQLDVLALHRRDAYCDGAGAQCPFGAVNFRVIARCLQLSAGPPAGVKVSFA